jgi:hypothetical protein
MTFDSFVSGVRERLAAVSPDCASENTPVQTDKTDETH